MLTYHCRVNIPSSERLFRSLRGSTLGVPAEFCCVSRQLLAVFHNTPMFRVHTFLMTARLTSYRSLRVLELRDRAPAHRVAGRNLSCARVRLAFDVNAYFVSLARSRGAASGREPLVRSEERKITEWTLRKSKNYVTAEVLSSVNRSREQRAIA